MQLIDELRRAYTKYDNVIRKLILINVGVFVLVNVIGLVLKLFGPSPLSRGPMSQAQIAYNNLLTWFELPLQPMRLLMQPWSFLTHMFMHAGLGHIFFNMLALYLFGNILQGFVGNRKTSGVYFTGGFAGALLALLVYNILPGLSESGNMGFMLGASAAVMAVVAAAPTLLPHYTVSLILIGPIKLKYIALVLFAINLISIKDGINTGGAIAHIGGAITGYFYIKQLNKGNDFGAWIGKLFSPLVRIFSGKPSMKVSGSKKASTAGREKPDQDEIDSILDKISRSGYESLTRREKELLFKASKDE
jgi:membrane associated rhomboid family serine protease